MVDAQVDAQHLLSYYPYIVGIDEAGRGPLFGPVVASCAYVPHALAARDSKQLSARQRRTLYRKIVSSSIYSIAYASPQEIDRLNIFHATNLCFERAARLFIPKYPFPLEQTLFVIDGRPIKISLPARYICIEKADEKIMPVSAASIVAKVTRDFLTELGHLIYPEYGFNKHRGYGTKEHCAMIRKNGRTPLHRKTFTIA